MQDYDKNHDNLERLSEEIRKLGTPYSSPEPDDRYWAGLRVRVMERISMQEERSALRWTDRVREFFAAHLLGTSLAGVAAAVIVSLTVILQPFSSSNHPAMGPMASQTAPPVAPVPNPAIVKDFKDELAQRAADLQRATDAQNASDARSAKSHSRKEWLAAHSGKTKMDAGNLAMASDADELAGQPVLMHSESDYPVSLNELSTSQLESVLHTMQDQK